MKKEILSNIKFYTKLRNDFTFHSSAIEGSTVTYEDNEKAVDNGELEHKTYEHDEWQENVNCGALFDYVFATIDEPLTERELKVWHNIIKKDTKWAYRYTSSYGDYKKLPNSVGASKVSQPHEVAELMKHFIKDLNEKKKLSLEDISELHCKFETIHPFLDGNGRIGRFIMLKQCLNNNIDLFFISNDTSSEYKNALRMYSSTKNSNFLTTYLKSCQSIFKIVNSMYFDKTLNDNEIKILDYINSHKEITMVQVQKLVELTLTPSNSLINKLIDKGYISKFNQGKNTIYRFKK